MFTLTYSYVGHYQQLFVSNHTHSLYMEWVWSSSETTTTAHHASSTHMQAYSYIVYSNTLHVTGLHVQCTSSARHHKCPKCTAMLDWCMQLEFDMHVRMVPQKKWEHVDYHGNKSASIRLLDPLLPHIMMKKYSTH